MNHKKILSGFLSTACIISAAANQNLNLATKAVILGEQIVSDKTQRMIERLYDSGKIRKEYIIRVLNFQNSFMYLESGIVENYRKFDGNKRKIKYEPNTWSFGKDKGNGSTNLLRILFPSSAGTLNTHGGIDYEHKLVEDLTNDELTPNLIAKIIGACYKYRYDENFKNEIGYFVNLFENSKKISYERIDSNFFYYAENIETYKELEKNLSKKQENDPNKLCILNTDEEEILLNLAQQKIVNRKDIEKAKNNDIKSFKKIFKDVQSFNKSLDEDAKLFNEMKKLVKEKLDINYQPSGKKSFATILNFLLNAFYMIKNQEQKNDDDTNKFVPKFTCEKMIMSFFIQKFNEEHIALFYDQIYKDFSQNFSEDDPAFLKKETKEKKESEKINNIINKTSEKPMKYLNPYKTTLCQNSRIPFLERLKNQKLVLRPEKQFGDCVETAIMHSLNFLFYSINGDWGFFDKPSLKYNDENTFEKFKKACENENFEDLEYLPFKERFLMFYKYLIDNKADLDSFTGSERCKNFWNYVVSNMHVAEKEDMFALMYCTKSSEYPDYCSYNELESSLLNFLSFIYNVASVLKEELGIQQNVLTSAKNSLEDLIQKVNTQENSLNKEDVEKTIKEIYSLLNPNVKKIKIDENINISDRLDHRILCTDFKTKIFKEDYIGFVFESKVRNGHSQISYSVEEDPTTKEINTMMYGVKKALPRIFIEKISAKREVIPHCYGISFEALHSDLFMGNSLDFDKNANKEYLLKNKFLKNLSNQNVSEIDIDILLRFFLKDSSISEDKSYFDVIDTKILKKKIYEIYKSDSCSKEQKEKIKTALEKAYNENQIDEEYLIKVIGEEEIKDWTIRKKPYDNTLRIPQKATNLTIKENAFKNCDEIKSLVFPDNVKNLTIEEGAFESCSNLNKIKSPKSLNNLTISERSFKSCDKLKEITFFKADCITIRYSAFDLCKNLEKIKFNHFVKELFIELSDNTKLEKICFSNKLNILNTDYETLKNFEIPETSNVVLWQSPNQNNQNQKEIEFSGNISDLRVAYGAFKHYENLKKIRFLEGIKKIKVEGQNFTQNCNLEEIIFPNSLEELTICEDFDSFKNRKINLPNKIKKLSINFENLENFNIPNQIELEVLKNYRPCKLDLEKFIFPEVKKLTIKTCPVSKNLKEIKFSNGIKKINIDENALATYTKLEKIELPESLEELIMSLNIFDCDCLLKTIKLPEKITKVEIDGMVFEGEELRKLGGVLNIENGEFILDKIDAI